MAVALRALRRESKGHLADTVHAVKQLNHSKLLGDDCPFFIDHAVSQKACGNNLVLSHLRQQVSGDLFDQELIVGQILIQGPNDPIPPDPLVAAIPVGPGLVLAAESRPIARQDKESVRLSLGAAAQSS